MVIVREGGKSSIFILEVNPRSSRTVPFMSKVTGVPMVKLATKVMAGLSLKEQGYHGGLWKRSKLVGIKAPVFSMSKLIGVDNYLGPEMKSTGEVMGIDFDFPGALTKALLASNLMLAPRGSVLLSIADRDKTEALPLVKQLHELGYGLYATEGTAAMIGALGMPVKMVTKKLSEGHPNVVDVLRDGSVNAVVNTITGGRLALKDGFAIRRTAVERRVPCYTSLDTLKVVLDAVSALKHPYNVESMATYLKRKK
jgi:carbamoyl-phosphate synthase large subunit